MQCPQQPFSADLQKLSERNAVSDLHHENHDDSDALSRCFRASIILGRCVRHYNDLHHADHQSQHKSEHLELIRALQGLERNNPHSIFLNDFDPRDPPPSDRIMLAALICSCFVMLAQPRARVNAADARTLNYELTSSWLTVTELIKKFVQINEHRNACRSLETPLMAPLIYTCAHVAILGQYDPTTSEVCKEQLSFLLELLEARSGLWKPLAIKFRSSILQSQNSDPAEIETRLGNFAPDMCAC